MKFRRVESEIIHVYEHLQIGQLFTFTEDFGYEPRMKVLGGHVQLESGEFSRSDYKGKQVILLDGLLEYWEVK